MTDSEIQAEIAKQVRDKLALLAASLGDAAQHNGPVIGKTLRIIARAIDELEKN